ncbi:AfsR/SARP family transcriptional regulator [Solicola gregarius]|uniref:Winged helix-turn-helix domain-containing protein n=1 Tax=Solicola gregarius TaxID=2908642 RepID=A0AA46THR9_9ACTN|nr:BTAD domain-containing putative transcriptional regulator [Solicola gregarius]UYM05089.1 winged helix-turn-helix domain-containing protein [Solicola gregarius]
MVHIRLVGAVEAVRDGEALALPGKRVRALLVLLALSAGRAVAVDTLARGIWDDEPPERVRGSLQTYVGRLRRVLGESLIETQRPGYVLQVPRASVDLLAFVDAVDAAAEVEPEAERAALGEILEQWSSPPFGEPPSEWIARHEVPAWTERYLQAVERKVDLDLRSGDYASCIVELNRNVERHPLRETLWVRLLTALDAAGRTAEALDRYESVRKKLAEDLGVDPSPELRSVHASLLTKAGDSSPTAPRTVRPHQLPGGPRGFVGRDAVLQELDQVAAGSAGTGGVIALHGPAGSGKTSVATSWAQDRLDRFPDGQLFLNLRGYGPGEPVTSSGALDMLLRSVGAAATEIPPDVDERSALLRSTLADRRVLVVLDNARDDAQVRPLLAGGATTTLVTTRSQLRSLVIRDGATRIAVGRMSPDESVRLLEERLGPGPSRADLTELAEHCGHLPIALAVAAERVERSGNGRIDDLNAQLRDRQQRLPALSTSDDDPLTNVRTVLESSYRALDEPTAQAFRAVGMYEDPQVTAAAVAALAGIDLREAERRLDRLVGQNLLMSLGSGWYECHDLLRDLAVELGVSTMPERVNAEAMERLWNWCLHSTRNASYLISPPRSEPIHLDLLEGVRPQEFRSELDASEWLSRHACYLRTVIGDANAAGDPTGYLLAIEFFLYLNIQSGLASAGGLYEQAEANARAAGDLLGEAECASCRGAVHSERREYDDALTCARRTRDLYVQAGEPSGVLKAETNIALTLFRLDRLDEAVAAYEQVIDDAREQGLTLTYAMGLADVADVYLALGRTDDARHAAAAAVAKLRESGNVRALAAALDRLGGAQAADGRGKEAILTYEESAHAVRRLGAATFEAPTLRTLGGLYRDAGRRDDARASWNRALRLLEDAGVDDTFDVSRSELQELLTSLPMG